MLPMQTASAALQEGLSYLLKKSCHELMLLQIWVLCCLTGTNCHVNNMTHPPADAERTALGKTGKSVQDFKPAEE